MVWLKYDQRSGMNATMKTQSKVASLTAALITFGSLAGGANGAVTLTVSEHVGGGVILVGTGTIDVTGWGHTNDSTTGAGVFRIQQDGLFVYQTGSAWEQWATASSTVTATGGFPTVVFDSTSLGVNGNGLAARNGIGFQLYGASAQADSPNQAPADTVFSFDLTMIDNDGDIKGCHPGGAVGLGESVPVALFFCCPRCRCRPGLNKG